ncbi:MAG: hypothetical protein P8Y58_05770, partial [Novosphingobium sp.]
MLALNAPQTDARMAAAETTAPKPAPLPAPAAELPPVVADHDTDGTDKLPAGAVGHQASSFAAAFASPAETAPLETRSAKAPKAKSTKFVSQPKVQPLGTARSAFVATPEQQ